MNSHSMDDQQQKPEGEEKPEKTSFWKTFPGILTGIAALITAVATLLVAADKAGLLPDSIGQPQQQKVEGNSATTSGENSPVVQNTGGDVNITADQ